MYQKVSFENFNIWSKTYLPNLTDTKVQELVLVNLRKSKKKSEPVNELICFTNSLIGLILQAKIKYLWDKFHLEFVLNIYNLL